MSGCLYGDGMPALQHLRLGRQCHTVCCIRAGTHAVLQAMRSSNLVLVLILVHTYSMQPPGGPLTTPHTAPVRPPCDRLPQICHGTGTEGCMSLLLLAALHEHVIVSMRTHTHSSALNQLQCFSTPLPSQPALSPMGNARCSPTEPYALQHALCSTYCIHNAVPTRSHAQRTVSVNLCQPMHFCLPQLPLLAARGYS
jgi:hypothetical protein